MRGRSLALVAAHCCALGAAAPLRAQQGCDPAVCVQGEGFSIDWRESAGLAPVFPAPATAPDAPAASGLELPGGGRLWGSEDPAVLDPRLAVQASGAAVLVGRRLREPVRFAPYTNYEAFQERYELALYRQDDTDLARPIWVQRGPASALREPVVWEGEGLPASVRPGEVVLYVLRVFDAQGRFDETRVRELVLSDPVAHVRERQLESFTAAGALDRARDPALDIYGQSDLARQTIPLQGSRVRVAGDNLGGLASLHIGGQATPVDERGRAVRELLLPLGHHEIEVRARELGGEESVMRLPLEVSGTYFFAVGLADLSVGRNRGAERLQMLGADEHYDGELFSDGRAAFSLKGKLRGRYLLTARADTDTSELRDLVRGLGREDPNSVFRRLDPDRFYPAYGDDSTAIADADSQGRLYARLDWDKSQLLWGNYQTGLRGSEFSQYERSLYGAKLDWRSTQSTAHGDPRRQTQLFVSEAQSALARNEFLGTGGSLYYLRHADVVQGSEKVAVEVRERDSGRVVESSALVRGRDYDMDELQGRILLQRPLLQVARDAVAPIIRDQPLDGNDVVLTVAYEYVPESFEADQLTGGGRAETWFGDVLGVGGRFVHENRDDGTDHELAGAEATLRAGRGTYLRAELSNSHAVQTDDAFASDDGGVSFARMRPLAAPDSGLSGDAFVLESRASFAELSGGRAQGSAGAWWKRRDEGFSSARADAAGDREDYGAEALWQASDALRFSGRASVVTRAEAGRQSAASGALDWRFAEGWNVGAELRRTSASDEGTQDRSATLAGLRLAHDVTRRTQLWLSAQTSLARSGSYEQNDGASLGARSRVTDRLHLDGEVSSGDRGAGVRVGGDYEWLDGVALYTSYGYGPDRSDPDKGRSGSATLGQRARLSNYLQVFGEQQLQHGARQSGIGHSYGLEFSPAREWSARFTMQVSNLRDELDGALERKAASATVAWRSERSRWSSRLELRRDGGDVARTQWLTAHRWEQKLSDELRGLASANLAWTRDREARDSLGKLAELSFGMAYRPVWNDRWNWLSKYTFLYDAPSPAQLAAPGSRAHVLALESIYALGRRWQLGAKLAWKRSQVRVTGGSGSWLDVATHLATANVRYEVLQDWDAMLEYRWLAASDEADSRRGALFGIYRHLGDRSKLGVGYSFADFSDDLVHLDRRSHGWFVNLLSSF